MTKREKLPAARLALLTPKERDCLRLVMECRSSKQIARQLGISRTSVDTYVRRAREKLGLRDRYAAARVLEAWERGAVEVVSHDPGPQPVVAVVVTPQPGRSALRLPPLEIFSFPQRLGLVVGVSIAVAMIFGVVLTAMTAI